jgi:hypothetical protein
VQDHVHDGDDVGQGLLLFAVEGLLLQDAQLARGQPLFRFQKVEGLAQEAGQAAGAVVDVFQEQQPRGLLGVVQLGGAASLLAKDVVDIAEGLFEHGSSRGIVCQGAGGGAGDRRGVSPVVE